MPIGLNGSGPITGATTLNGLTIPTAGFGKVLQVVQSTYSTETLVQNTSFADTGLSCSITPSSTSSKVLVCVSQTWNIAGQAVERTGEAILVRGSTQISFKRKYHNVALGASNYNSTGETLTFIYLDSPSSSASVTYKTQGRVTSTANDGFTIFQAGSSVSTMILVEIGP